MSIPTEYVPADYSLIREAHLRVVIGDIHCFTINLFEYSHDEEFVDEESDFSQLHQPIPSLTADDLANIDPEEFFNTPLLLSSPEIPTLDLPTDDEMDF